MVINAAKVLVTGKKETKKKYMTYSGWKGGEKYTSVEQMGARQPERLITHAVRGMVPKNRLGRVLMTKLKVYKGAAHPHADPRLPHVAPALLAREEAAMELALRVVEPAIGGQGLRQADGERAGSACWSG